MAAGSGDGTPAGLSRTALRRSFEAVERLAGGLGTAILALLTLLGWLTVTLLSVVGVGLLLVPAMLTAQRAVADRERERLHRWGHDLVDPYQPRAAGLRARLRDPATRRDLAWTAWHGTGGLLLGMLGVLLPLLAVRDLTFPLWWHFLPPDDALASLGFPVRGWTHALASLALGLAWLAILIGLGPAIARLQALPAVRLLGPRPGVDVSGRVAELTASRAAALQAHAAELRRIERSLHDGAQNRLVGAVVLIAAAKQSLRRDPASAEAALDNAHTAAEQALAELRSLVRGILPPVLEDRGLDGALSALAAGSPVPCQLQVDIAGRCVASVEATAYYVVAEALTNIAKHSGADQAEVTARRDGDRLRLRVQDDGDGGAQAPTAGSGLAGVSRRVAAHDGTFTLSSPPGGPTVIEVELPCGS